MVRKYDGIRRYINFNFEIFLICRVKISIIYMYIHGMYAELIHLYTINSTHYAVPCDAFYSIKTSRLSKQQLNKNHGKIIIFTGINE